MLLAVVAVSWAQKPPRYLRGPLAYSGTWVLAAVVCGLLVCDHYSWDLLTGGVAFFLVGACVLPLRSSLPVRMLSWKPLAALGVASYSLYIWHFNIVTDVTAHQLKGDSFIVDLAILLPICVIVALISYRVIEEPFLRLRKRWQGAPAR
jgi:peptidoglycan/LPS O-acetylase OafA/YrhL